MGCMKQSYTKAQRLCLKVPASTECKNIKAAVIRRKVLPTPCSLQSSSLALADGQIDHLGLFFASSTGWQGSATLLLSFSRGEGGDAGWTATDITDSGGKPLLLKFPCG